jgi:protein-S-isoprenylcysteine O-methyltransferase
MLVQWVSEACFNKYCFVVSCFLGAIMVICGQVLRSAAMITAANNFNHLVQYKKADSHKLVTVGVYS